MFEFAGIVMFLIGAVCGAFLGVLLGRRSMTANRVVDQIRAEYEARLARLRANSQSGE